MNTLINNILDNHFSNIKKKEWDYTYWAIDIHKTIVYPDYKVDSVPKKMYPNAEKVLKILTERDDIKLILYTCSHPNEIEEYLKHFKSLGIKFDYVNKSGIENDALGDYSKKIYFNVLLEDKAGFYAEKDWYDVEFALKMGDSYLKNNSIKFFIFNFKLLSRKIKDLFKTKKLD
jgi:hypothetical protein